jgi:hypothetical protein
MRFFVDNNLSVNIVLGLRAFGEDVTHLTECFPPEVQDVELLKYIGEKGWFLITRDERIRYNIAEFAALKRYKVGAFFIGGKNRGRCALIRQIVRNWPRIKEQAAKNRTPFAYKVPPTGTKFKKYPL